LVTVLFLFAIAVAGEDALSAPPLLARPLAWGLVLAATLFLGWFVLPELPLPRSGTTLPFATVLWEQRGLDVLVQVALIFSGALGLPGLHTGGTRTTAHEARGSKDAGEQTPAHRASYTVDNAVLEEVAP
jgi:hypothetical protein